MNAREAISRAFAATEFAPDLQDYEFAGERADEGDRLADIALAALKEAGYSLMRRMNEADEAAGQDWCA